MHVTLRPTRRAIFRGSSYGQRLVQRLVIYEKRYHPLNYRENVAYKETVQGIWVLLWATGDTRGERKGRGRKFDTQHWGRELAGWFVVRVGTDGSDVDCAINQLIMPRRKRVDRRSGEKESERVFSVEIEAEEAFLANEPKGFIKR